MPAEFLMVLTSVVPVNDTLGGKNPCVVDVISNFAEAFGVVVPIPTCALLVSELAITNSVIIILFFIVYIFLLLAPSY